MQELEDKVQIEMMHADQITLLFCDTRFNSESEPDAS